MFNWSKKSSPQAATASVSPAVVADPKMQAALRSGDMTRSPDAKAMSSTGPGAIGIVSPEQPSPAPHLVAVPKAEPVKPVLGRSGDTIPNASAGHSSHVPGAPTGNGNGSGGKGGAGGPGGPADGGIFKHTPPEGHAKKVSEVLGEIVWLMSQSPLHKQFFISDLEWSVAKATNEKC